jgi:hypothetical protein
MARAEIARRQDARIDLLAFTTYTKPAYLVGPHHPKITAALEAVERGDIDRLMIMCPPRHGKPCYIECMILMHDGSYKRLADIMVGDRVITHEGRSHRVLAVHEQGNLPSVSVRTELGRETFAALDHPFLTASGWKNAEDLVPGDVLATVPNAQIEPSCSRSIDEFIMAGYFAGDGHVKKNFCRMTRADQEVVDDFTASMDRMGFVTRVMTGKKYGYSFVGRGRKRADVSPLHWTRDAGLVAGSHTKRIPPWVFTGSREQVSALVGAYFACYGSLNARGNTRDDCCLEFYSVSMGLLQDVQKLLLRLGVRSRLVVKNGRYKGEVHKSWRLAVTSMDDAIQFREAVRLVGPKAKRLAEWPLRRTRFAAKYLTDAVVSITPSGNLPCRCLTVETDHTFTVDDLVVHNSEIVSRRFPPWYLGRNPRKQVISASYGQSLANDFGRDTRNIIGSEDFARVFPETGLAADSFATNRWHTNKGGVYVSAGVGGPITGKGADILSIDDPFKDREDADSEVNRETVWNWYTSTAYTRLMPGGAVILTMTRWHPDDLAGRLLDAQKTGGDRWEVLSLPAIDDEGKALWPAWYGRPALDRIRANIGERDWAALYDQNPRLREGSLFKIAKMPPPLEASPVGGTVVRAWDLAATAQVGGKNPDYTVGLKLHRTAEGRFVVLDVLRMRGGPEEVEAAIVNTAAQDGKAVKISLPQDTVESSPETGSKETRAAPVASQVNVGNVDIVKAGWNMAFLAELADFPGAVKDDQVDALSRAFSMVGNQRGPMVISRQGFDRI